MKRNTNKKSTNGKNVNKVKRYLMIFVACMLGLLMIILLIPVITKNALRFELNDDGTGYIVYRKSYEATKIVIPDTHRGLPVTGIGEGAFANCLSLKSIEIPSSVTRIGEGAFNSAHLMKDVYYTGNVEEWLSITFDSERSNPMSVGDNPNLYFDEKLVTNIEIPNTIKSIPNYAFVNCHSLTSITIPDSVTSIGDGAFRNCILLTSIIIPDSVTSIGEYAFGGCDALASITIPDSVMSIGYGAFVGCESLTSISIPNGITVIEGNTFAGCRSLGEIIIPSGVKEIGIRAFSNCRSLKSIIIPYSVQTMGEDVFEMCRSLEKIYCETNSKPSGWDDRWHGGYPSNYIIWGYINQ